VKGLAVYGTRVIELRVNQGEYAAHDVLAAKGIEYMTRDKSIPVISDIFDKALCASQPPRWTTSEGFAEHKRYAQTLSHSFTHSFTCTDSQRAWIRCKQELEHKNTDLEQLLAERDQRIEVRVAPPGQF